MSNTLKIPGPVGEVSDGYHTFNELYEHRHALMLAFMKAKPDISWFSLRHHDGTEMPGWFIAGIRLPDGDITYHLPERLFLQARFTGANEMGRGHQWDGHTSGDVVSRLMKFVNRYTF